MVDSAGDSRPSALVGLPAQTTSFVGRERELLAVARLLLSPQIRLVTLTGPGGIGKTRLAIEAGSSLSDSFRDGVFFVPLAPIRESEAAMLAIARAVGLREAGDRPLLEALKEHLRDRELLLILDNSEQVVAAILVVNELLAASAGLKLLVTSRAVLNIRGEHQFEVPALGLPLKERAARLEEIERCDAVVLFVERARAIRSNFALTEDNAADVAEICRRLEGIPLAIELAAARVKLFTPQAMLARLTSRLGLLGGGLEDLPERQRTMRNAIAWSYELLRGLEQRLFQRLAIFPGGCTLESAETVCGDDLELDIVDGIDSLVRKSLARTEEKAGEIRFSMLETIREYGLEMLDASGGRQEISRRCSEFLLKLAESAEPDLTGPRQAEWMARLEAEHDNLRFALRWGLDSGDAEQSLRIAGAMYRFWGNRGHLTEGRKWLEDSLHATVESNSPFRAKALRGAGLLAWWQGDFEPAVQLQEQSLAISRRIGDQRGVAASLNNLGGVAADQGNRPRAKQLGEEALSIYRALGDETNLAVLLNNLGVISEQQGDYATAASRFRESLDICRETGDKSRMAVVLTSLGYNAMRQGQYELARTYCEESLEISREAGNRLWMAQALSDLGEIAIHGNDCAVAESCLKESIGMLREMGNYRSIAQALERFAALATIQGEVARAALLLGAADALREVRHIVRPPGEHVLYNSTSSRAIQRLGKEVFAASCAEGRALTAERAMEEALGARVPEAPTAPKSPPQSQAVPLTPREIEVVRLVAQGLTNSEIAGQLVISPRTAETHVNHVLNRLGFNSRVQVAAWAIQKGLVPSKHDQQVPPAQRDKGHPAPR